MGKSIKHMAYDIIGGKMVWRTIKQGETPREIVCLDCQIKQPKKNRQVRTGFMQQEAIPESMSGDSE